jgi:phosphoserine phosphatase
MKVFRYCAHMPRIAFFDVDNTITRGSTLYFLGRGMYNRGFFTKRDIGAWVLANIRFHGDEVWLVTASPEDFANLIAERLGFTGAIGTKAEIKDGKYTGNLTGKLLHGKEKAIAIEEMARTRNIDLKECFAYSDSHNDLPLLSAVGNPRAINPDAKLRIMAFSQGWPVHDFRRLRWLNRVIGPIVSRFAGFWVYLTAHSRR